MKILVFELKLLLNTIGTKGSLWLQIIGTQLI